MKPRTAPMARRRNGDIAPYRNGTRAWGAARDTSVGGGAGHERGARHGVRGAHGVDTGVEHGAGVGSGAGELRLRIWIDFARISVRFYRN